MSRQELKAAILELPDNEFLDLARWIDSTRAEKWDAQMESDAASGKLAALYRRLQSENEGAPEIPLNEVLDDPKLS